jgi:hypothetical protein
VALTVLTSASNKALSEWRQLASDGDNSDRVADPATSEATPPGVQRRVSGRGEARNPTRRT